MVVSEVNFGLHMDFEGDVFGGLYSKLSSSSSSSRSSRPTCNAAADEQTTNNNPLLVRFLRSFSCGLLAALVDFE